MATSFGKAEVPSKKMKRSFEELENSSLLLGAGDSFSCMGTSRYRRVGGGRGQHSISTDGSG